eukprot:TRINITY_DN1748_c0_g2_i6.p2 TRINITY_DN1748_c0_g2~~TRINITY_DN1748_c0_g2_i6.p2  ORF type:complete len:103 (-),score=21.17 TRINITY_DN1748_c0_g2_i6:372-680(-)
MCIRDRYMGIQKIFMEPKKVIGVEAGILTDILSDKPGVDSVVAWVEAKASAQMYKVLDKNKKVSYIIKQYHHLKIPKGQKFKERAMKEKEISDILCKRKGDQ